MPLGRATTAHHLGAPSAHYRFDDYNACPPEPWRRRDDSRYAEWQQVNGSVVPCRVSLVPNPSELFSAYAIALDADRASSAASNHALQLAATDLEYEVTRVKSPVLGRDLNPMGRGDGAYYCNGGNLARSGSFAIRGAKPRLVGEKTTGVGSSVNNQCGAGAGMGGAGETPYIPIWRMDPNDPSTWWRLKNKRFPTGLDVPLIYWSLWERKCVGNAGGVLVDIANGGVYCQDKCTVTAAIAFAVRITAACTAQGGTPECEAYVVELPKTLREALSLPENYWGVFFSFHCSGSPRSPLVSCLCREKKDWWGLRLYEANKCLEETFGGRVIGCNVQGGTGSGGDGGGDGGGNGGGNGKPDPEREHETVMECIERVLREYGGDAGVNWALAQIQDCIENALIYFLICMLGASTPQQRSVCVSKWYKDMAACATEWLEKLPEEIAKEVLKCFEQYV